MLSQKEFQAKIAGQITLLDGATGSNLQKMGMPRGCCTESWVLDNPDKLIRLQQQYYEAGSQIIYAPTFQAQPIALARVGLADKCEQVNAQLVQLSKKAAPGALIAGDLTTLAVYTDSWDEANFDLLVDNYRRQIRGLIDGGADLLAAETLMYPLEAEAILTAAELEGAGAVMYTFTMQPDGALFSGMDGIKILKTLEDAGAAAVGFNCVAADNLTAGLVAKMHRSIRIPLVCKPNAGNPVIGEDQIPVYPMGCEEFAAICADCAQMSASLLGGCCGTTPAHIRAVNEKCKIKKVK